jgi:hypothetical protein
MEKRERSNGTDQKLFSKGENLMKSLKTLFIVLFVAAWLLVGCSSGDQAAPADSGEVALKITGSVANEKAWTDAQVKAMKIVEAEYTNKDGETNNYTGVLIADLLNEASATGSNVIFLADDGFSNEVPLAEVLACENCIVAFRDQGGYSIVMPDYPGKAQVKGVVEIQVR